MKLSQLFAETFSLPIITYPRYGAKSKIDIIIDHGWVRWYGNTWRHKDYPDKLEGFTTTEVLNIINKKYNEIKDIDIASLYPWR